MKCSFLINGLVNAFIQWLLPQGICVLLLSTCFSKSCCSAVLSVLLPVLKLCHYFSQNSYIFITFETRLIFHLYSTVCPSYDIYFNTVRCYLLLMFLWQYMGEQSPFWTANAVSASRLFSFFLPRFSLLYTKQPATGPYTHHDEPNQHSPIAF